MVPDVSISMENMVLGRLLHRNGTKQFPTLPVHWADVNIGDVGGVMGGVAGGEGAVVVSTSSSSTTSSSSSRSITLKEMRGGTAAVVVVVLVLETDELVADREVK